MNAFKSLSVVVTTLAISANISIADDQTEATKALREATKIIKGYEARIQALENKIQTTIPVGGIVAFDRPDGCPTGDGWESFDAASGRMILGVGPKVNAEGIYELPYVGGRPRYQTGGAETHTLHPLEMPAHNHDISRTTNANAGGTEAALVRDTQGRMENYRVTATGGNQPHNNMPPYIALYFCKKVGQR